MSDAVSRVPTEAASPPAFLIIDTESVPDGKLLARVKYADESLTPEEAVARAQAEARERSTTGSDFLPVAFQYPVAVCVVRVGADFGLQQIACLDAPQFRPRKIVEQFWAGLARYKDSVQLVTYNGRGFDLPLLELAAFRYGCRCGPDYFERTRKRYSAGHTDLMEWFANYGAVRTAGGLNLLSKLLGNPGKMQVAGDQVYQMHREGKAQEISDYCMFDTLDTFFVFLRTQVMTGKVSLEQEHIAVLNAKEWLAAKVAELPALQRYLANWGDWDPWP
jgi:predicted PolB exonuclease-like 3'-5' exonuclease